MNLETLKNLTVDNVDERVQMGGTGPEETFRNVMLHQIAVQLMEINEVLIDLVKAIQTQDR